MTDQPTDPLRPAPPPGYRYGRLLLKLSGEALIGPDSYGINLATLNRLAADVKELHGAGVQVAVVIGGGNIFRGVRGAAQGMDRASADYMGMTATIINSLALQDALEKTGVPTRVQTAIAMGEVAEPYIRRKAIRHLEKGRVVVFAAGTGNPYFTTDTAAALRAMEIHAEIIFKGTKVDGVYERDPVDDPTARRFNELTYDDALAWNLRVMDATAISLCRENELPILVFSINGDRTVQRAASGERVGTLVWSRKTILEGGES